MKLIDNFKYLPNDIVQNIVNYTDVIVYRYGKYINRIKKNDIRIILLTRIPRPIYNGYHKILLRLLSCNNKGYFLEYYMCNYITRVNIRFFIKEKDGINNYYDIKSDETYILDGNNRWSRILDYTM